VYRRSGNLLIRETVILRGRNFIDPTICEFAGHWWLWCTISDSCSDGCANLHLFHAETPLGPWQAHPSTPVVSDVRSARPGGRPFIVDGVLYRPAQDCSREYGGALTINRVDVLNTREYRETPVRHISPDRAYPHGLHHLEINHGKVVIDGKRRLFSLRPLAHRWFRRSQPTPRIQPWHGEQIDLRATEAWDGKLACRNIDPDGWCHRDIRLDLLPQGVGACQLSLLIPGTDPQPPMEVRWSHRSGRGRIAVLPGHHTLVIPLPKDPQPLSIRIRFNWSIMLAAPDTRRRSVLAQTLTGSEFSQ
jgi:hypothetical protein